MLEDDFHVLMEYVSLCTRLSAGVCRGRVSLTLRRLEFRNLEEGQGSARLDFTAGSRSLCVPRAVSFCKLKTDGFKLMLL